ncbi:MAG TPA: PilZ domain-containing protein [Polyangiales bacterium]|nr:PilZ domain-containing protein [Polyangiales bacterium]
MRAVVSLVARYRSPTTFEYANEFCSDLSVGGMFIKSAAPAPAGTLLKLECETDDTKVSQIRGVARVVWQRRETNEHGPSGMGVKFVKLEPGSRELIEALVQRMAEAGVHARSVSAAPEHLAAAAVGGGVAAAAAAVSSSEPQAQPLRLVHSEPPAAAEANDTERRAAAPAAPEPESAAESDSAVEPSQPIAAAAPARPIAEQATLPATGSSRPPPPQPSRFGMRGWIIAIVLVLIAIAIADRRGFGSKDAEVTPEPPSAPAEPKAPEPAPAAVQPKAAEPTPPPPSPAPAAEPEAKPAEPAAAPQAAAEPTAAAAAGSEGPLYPLAAGETPYIVEFVSKPSAVSVTIDDKITLVTPAELNLGTMPDRVKLVAKKAGFKPSSAWLTRDGFENKKGALRKRAYLTLKADSEK